MTRTYTILIIIALLLSSSRIFSQVNELENRLIVFPVHKELLPKVDSILRKYVEVSCSSEINNSIVVQLFIYSYLDSAVFCIKPCQYRYEIFEQDISGYIKVGNCLVIIYADIDLLFKKDPLLISNLNMELDKKHLKKKGEAPFIDDTPPWIVSIHRETKTIIVIKRGIEPYFHKVKIDTLYPEDVIKDRNKMIHK